MIWRCVGATLGREGPGTAAAAVSTGGVDEWEVWDTGTSRGCAVTDGLEAGVEPSGSGERGRRNTRLFPVKVHNSLRDDTIPTVRHVSCWPRRPMRAEIRSVRPTERVMMVSVRAATARLRAVVVLAVTAAAVLVGASAAQAHNTLVSTDPAQGAVVAAAPARVTLTFNEPARSLGTEVVVTAPDGTTVSTGEAVLDGVTVSQDVTGALPAGAYTVTWRVTSADGHPLEGVLSFTATGATTVGGAPPAAVTPTPAPTATPTPSITALAAAASIEPVAPTGETTIGPVVSDQDADEGGGLLSGVVIAGVAALVVVLVVAGAVLVARRRAHARRSHVGRT
jgi:methionine-rich copper-binding protein CopC